MRLARPCFTAMNRGRSFEARALAYPTALAKPVLASRIRNTYIIASMDNDIPSAAARGVLGKDAPVIAHARFSIGDIVRHRMFDFRGVIFDIDPVFANSEEWYEAIPEDIRPRKDQPFYHLLAENSDSSYVAYVSQQNLLQDDSDEPVDHPAISGIFDDFAEGRYTLRREHRH